MARFGMETRHDSAKDLGAAQPRPTGKLELLRDVWGPQLQNRRDLLIYLPPSYSQAIRRYPVVYMQDGQNLFGRGGSYADDWQVEQTMALLYREGIEAIVVGIPSTAQRRIDEYSPFRDRRYGGGNGQRYAQFMIETVKPLVDETFRTMPGRENSLIIGSSLGGLISLYSFFRYPAVFGKVGALSPATWFANGALISYLRYAPPVPGKIYLDVGGRELSRDLRDRLLRRSARYRNTVRGLYHLFLRRGYVEGQDLLYTEEAEGIHHESAWARRLPDALRFLLR